MARKSTSSVFNLLASFAVGLTILAGGVLTNNGRYDSAAHANNVGHQIPVNAGVPVDVTGSKNGDMVLDTTGSDLYARIAGVWTKISNGISAIGDSIGSATEGSVLFVGPAGILAQDNANLFYNDTLNNLGLGTVAPILPLHIVGAGGIRIDSTAVADSNYVRDIRLDCAGFGDCLATSVIAQSGAMSNGDLNFTNAYLLDTTGSTGGTWIGYSGDTVGDGLVNVFTWGAGTGQNVGIHLSGGREDMDSALVNAVDERADLINDAVTTTIFVANNDTVTIGNDEVFGAFAIDIDSPASKTAQTTYEYSTGVGTFSSFPGQPSDTCADFTFTGMCLITWIIGDLVGWAVDGNSEFTIRLERNRSGAFTAPDIRQIEIEVGVTYGWDAAGNIDANAFRTTPVDTQTSVLSAYDVDGDVFTDFFTLTAGNTPTGDLSTAVTIGGNAILDDTSTVSALTTVGALNSGSITSGFGSIDIGTSALSSTGTHTGPSGTWDIGGMDLADTDSYAIAGIDLLVQTTGTATLSNIDVLDATTESTIEAAIDTLANLVSAAALAWTSMTTGTDGEIPTFDASGNPAFVAVGTATHVLTSNGVGTAPTFQAPAGAAVDPKIVVTTEYSTTGRYSTATSGSTITFATYGVRLLTGSGGTNHANLKWPIMSANAAGTDAGLFDGSPTFTASIKIDDAPTVDGQTFYIGLDDVQAATANHDFTEHHIGFKLVRVSGALELFATQGDGTTENASSALITGLVAGDSIDLIFVVNGSASADYYFRQGGASSLSAATNLTSNLPTAQGGMDDIGISIDNEGGTNAFGVLISGSSYSR